MRPSRQLRIGELAEQVGASTRSLRYYEQQGLLSPTRGANGHRVYGENEIVRAGNIRDLLAAGLTMSDIREYLAEGCLDRPLDDSPRCAAELQTLRGRLSTLDELIDRLQASRDRLAEHTGRLERSIYRS